jgi:hypothetical protein
MHASQRPHACQLQRDFFVGELFRVTRPSIPGREKVTAMRADAHVNSRVIQYYCRTRGNQDCAKMQRYSQTHPRGRTTHFNEDISSSAAFKFS